MLILKSPVMSFLFTWELQFSVDQWNLIDDQFLIVCMINFANMLNRKILHMYVLSFSLLLIKSMMNQLNYSHLKPEFPILSFPQRKIIVMGSDHCFPDLFLRRCREAHLAYSKLLLLQASDSHACFRYS